MLKRSVKTRIHHEFFMSHFKRKSSQSLVCTILAWNIVTVLCTHLFHALDVDECATNQHDCDPVGAVCTNTVGSYTCLCRQGYEDIYAEARGKECRGYHNMLIRIFKAVNFAAKNMIFVCITKFISDCLY